MAGIYQRELPTAPVFTPSRQYQNVDFGVNSLLKAGSILGEALGSVRDKELEDNKIKLAQDEVAENKRRWELANARAEAEFNQTQNDRKVVDAFNQEVSKGPQVIGGIYGDRLADASTKYQMTPEEIEWTKQNGMDPNAAKAAGMGGLSDKLNWQFKAGMEADSFVNSGMGNESRVDMYERINRGLLDQGLTPTTGMVDKLDSARLADYEAKRLKLDELTKQQGEIDKSNLDMLKFAVTNTGKLGGNEVIDSEGNVIGTSASQNKRELKLEDKYANEVASGEKYILEAIQKNKVGEKATVPEEALSAYKELLKRDPTISPMSAATALTGGLRTDKGAWYSPFSKDTMKYDPTALSNVTKSLSGTFNQADDLSSGSTVTDSGVSQRSARADALADYTTASNTAKSSKIANDKMALLRDDREVTNDKVDAWLQGRGLLERPKEIVSDSKAPTSKDYASKVKESESTNNYGAINKKSGALGAYQFLPSTLEDLKSRTGDKFTKEEFLKNPELQDKYFGLLTKSNAGRLEAMGIAPTEQNLYAAHNLGPGNVKKLLAGNEDGKVTGALKANSLDSAADWFERNKKFDAKNSGFISEDASGKDNAIRKAIVPIKETAVGKEATPLSSIKTKNGDILDVGMANSFAEKVSNIYSEDSTLNNPMHKIARATAGYFGGNDLGGNTQYGSGVLTSKSKANLMNEARKYGIDTQKDVQAIINEVDPKDTKTIDALKHMQYYMRYDIDPEFRANEQLSEAGSVLGNTIGQALPVGKVVGAVSKNTSSKSAQEILKNANNVKAYKEQLQGNIVNTADKLDKIYRNKRVSDIDRKEAFQLEREIANYKRALAMAE